MPRVEFHIVIFDEEEARRAGKWGEAAFAFEGMTDNQRTLMHSLLQRSTVKLESTMSEEEMAMSLRKTGSGKVLGEDQGGQQKTASTKQSWDQQDSEELAAESGWAQNDNADSGSLGT